jgi:hypothetical protein
MANFNQVTTSGDGTRPVTDGTADNIGAGEKFKPGGPAPKERMQDKRADAAADKKDDSVPLGIHTDKKPAPNTESPDGD